MYTLRFIMTVVFASCFFTNLARSSDDTIGTNGIRSAGLMLPNGNPLTGSGIGIGQVEGFRSGDPTQPGGAPFDTMANLLNSTVDPEEVFFTSVDSLSNPTTVNSFAPTANGASGPGGGNAEIDDHAVQVVLVQPNVEFQRV